MTALFSTCALAGCLDDDIERSEAELRSAAPVLQSWTYEAESDPAIHHGLGRIDGDGFSANVGADGQGHLIYGPYATYWGDGQMQVTMRAEVDNVTDGGIVAFIDVYDATTDTIIASRPVPRGEFFAPMQFQDVSLDFDLAGRADHAIETRLWWTDISYVNVDRVHVQKFVTPDQHTTVLGVTFAWNFAGPLADMHCVQIHEWSDPHTWTDNYFCSSEDIGLSWSSAGPIPGMECTQIHEGSDPHTWNDNYLCVPEDSSFHLSWSSASERGEHFVRWFEPADPYTWDDNYLTISEKICGVGHGYQGDCPGCGADQSSWATARSNSISACNASGCTLGCSSSTAAWDDCLFDNGINGYICTSWCGPEPVVCGANASCGAAQCQ